MQRTKIKSKNIQTKTKQQKVNLETKIIEFVNKNSVVLFFVFITLMAFILRYIFFTHKSGDYICFISIWIEKLSQFEGFSGLGENIGEYNVPYMFFLTLISKTPFNDLIEIKIFSIIFDFAGAFIAVKIISYLKNTRFFTPSNMLLYSLILFNPVVFLDSAYWAQCDFIYVSMIMVSVYYMLKEKFTPSMIFFGIALTFKLQSVMFLPVIIIFYFVSGKMKIKHFLWIPAVYGISIVPALIAGRGLKDTLSIYVNQTGIYKQLTMNCPNIYNLLQGDYNMFRNAGIILTMGILGTGALLFITKRKQFVRADMLLLTIWVTQSCICFLPSMHERYAFMTCIFSILWSAFYKKDWWITVVINFVCLLSFTPYLCGIEIIKLGYLAVVNIAVFIILSHELFVKTPKNNCLKVAS